MMVWQNNDSVPIVIGQNNNSLPINMVEPIEAQNNIRLPIGIVVEPIKARNNIQLPIVVEPVEAKSITDLTTVAKSNTDLIHWGRALW
jgi:hypothetical protein